VSEEQGYFGGMGGKGIDLGWWHGQHRWLGSVRVPYHITSREGGKEGGRVQGKQAAVGEGL
jgi:hypothetical protein